MSRGDPQVAIRLPADVKAFIKTEAELNACSQNSEIVRAIRERMKAIGAAGTAIPPRHDQSQQLEIAEK